MKKVLVALFVFTTMAINAENKGTTFTVTGQVLDSISNETMPYATCTVTSQNNPKQAIARFASDIDGNFKGELKNPGKYIISISVVGQATAMRSFAVDVNNKTVQLGKIKLSTNQQALKELNVVAVKPLIKAEADKITYDTEQDPESKSSTVLDMMRKVPMITVDGQDNIQLRGSNNYKFFLNGKPTNMFNNNAGIILKSMPANMVKNIEVITQPGAKYDAEGIGGIINIVTMQQTQAKGYSATFNAQTTSRGSYGGGLNLMLQSGKFSFSGNYNYSFNKQFPITTTSERNSYITNTPYPYSKQVATVENPTPMQFGSGQLSYELDTANLFTFSFNRRYGKPNSISTATTENYDANMNKVFEYDQNSSQHQSWGSTDFGLDYQHSFKKKGELLTLSYKLSNTPNSSNYEATNTINNAYSILPQIGLAHTSISNNIANTNEHTFQADYSKPLMKGHTLELGAKYIIRLNQSETEESYEYFNYSQVFPYTPYLSHDSTSFFKNNLNILGAYGSYNANIGKWSLKGGLRFEYTWLKAMFNEPARDFPAEYPAIVPSAIITYRITDMKSLKLGYNKRIQRPSISYLNPYVDRKDPNYISYGNPNLDPENSHTITLGYNSFAAKYNLSTELSYSFINNGIEQYSFINAGSTIQEITYDNIGHKKQVGLNIYGNYRGVKWMNLYMNGNINYVTLNSTDNSMSNSGLTGRLFVGGTFMLPKDFRISTGAGGNLPQVTLQGSQSAFYFSYLALSKDFFKKRFNVSLSGVYLPQSHIIVTTKGHNASTGAVTFDQKTDVHLTKNTELRLNLSYRLGNMNAQVKKTKSTISNDDQKEKDNSSMGQSPM